MAAILYFFDAALSRSHFLSDFLQVPSCLPVFAIDNQQNCLVTSANIADRVFVKNPKWPPKNKIFEIGQARCQFPLIHGPADHKNDNIL